MKKLFFVIALMFLGNIFLSGQTMIDLGGFNFEGASGTDPIYESDFGPVDISNCASIEVTYDYQWSLDWAGSGNMESDDECDFGNACAGDPTDPQADDCLNCWDMLYTQIFIDGSEEGTELYGLAGSQQSGSFAFGPVCVEADELEIEFDATVYATDEEITVTNITVVCWEISPTITTNDPICSNQDLQLDGDAADPGAVDMWQWTTNGISTIDDPSSQNTTASNVDDGDEFVLTTTDANGCTATDAVTVSVGGFDVDISGGGTICGCTDSDSDMFISINGGSPLYTATVDFGFGNVVLPTLDVSGLYRICIDNDVVIPTIDDSEDPILITVPDFIFPFDVELIEIVDDDGCMGTINSSTISYELGNAPDIGSPPDTEYCVGADGLIDLTIMDPDISNGTGLNVEWYTDDDLEDEINDPTQYDITDGNTVYAALNENGCIVFVEVGLNFSLEPEFTVLEPIIIDCGSDPYQLPPIFDVISVVNGLSPAYYLDEEHTMGPVFQIDPNDVTEIFIYDGNTNCDAVISIPLQITPFPVIESPLDTLGACGDLVLPEPEGQFFNDYQYNTAPDGNGISFFEGDIIAQTDNINVLFLIMEGDNGCTSVGVLDITLGDAINFSVNLPDPICDSLVLPNINPSTGSVAYYTASQGMGTLFQPGDVIYAPFSGNLFVFDPDLDPQCASELNLSLDITTGAQPIFPDTITGCDFIILPDFTGTPGPQVTYSTSPTDDPAFSLIPGDMVSMTDYIYVHDTLGQCVFFDSLFVSIIQPPNVGQNDTLSICGGFIDSTLDFMQLIGSPDLNGQWSFNFIPDFVFSDSTQVDVSTLPIGDFDFTYSIEIENCGLFSSNLNLKVIDPPFGGDNNVIEICSDSENYNFMELINNPDLNGEWVPATGSELVDLSDSTSVNFEGLPEGQYGFVYVIPVILSDSLLCDPVSSALIVNLSNGPYAGEDMNTSACLGDVVDLTSLLSPNADLNGVFESNGLLFSGNNWDTGVSAPDQDYVISYILESMTPDCPSDTAFITIALVDILTAGDPVSDLNVCEGEELTLEQFIDNESLGGQFIFAPSYQIEIPNGIWEATPDSTIAYIVQGAGSCPPDTTLLNFDVTELPDLNADLDLNTICNNNEDGLNLTLDNQSSINTDINLDIIDSNGQSILSEIITLGIGLTSYVIIPNDQTLLSNDSIYINNTVDTYTLSIDASAGLLNCPIDMPIDLELNVIEPYEEDIDFLVCEGDEVEFRGQFFTLSTRIDIDGNFIGCDSIFNLNINNHPQENGLVDGIFCIGDSVDVFDLRIGNDTIFTMVVEDVAQFGCDSIIDIDIAFQNAAFGFVDVSLCEGQDTTIENVLFNDMNTNQDITLTGGSVQGCDSIIVVEVSFVQSVDSELIRDICPGEEIIVGNDTYDQNQLTGSTTLIGEAAGGCDSIVNVNLTLLESSTFLIDDQLCPEDGSVEVNGNTYDVNDPDGEEVLLAVNGCDSTVTIALNFFEQNINEIDQQICIDEEIIIGNDTYNSSNLSGTTILDNEAASGCDSMVMVNLTLIQDAMFMLEETICPGQSITVGSDTYDENNTTGTTVLDNASFLGCDSIVNVNLLLDDPNVQIDAPGICPGESTALATLLSSNALTLPFQLTINGNSALEVTSLPFDFEAMVGSNTLEILDSNNCSLLETLDINEISEPFWTINSNLISINSYQLSIDASFPFLEVNWSPSLGLSCDNCAEPIANISDTITYNVTVTTDLGCSFMQSITLDFLEPPVTTRIFIPNLLDVNNPPNNIFYVRTNDDNMVINKMAIYDRWGNQVFLRNNILPNDETQGWDGTFNNAFVLQGVYVYFIEYVDGSGQLQIDAGDITILR